MNFRAFPTEFGEFLIIISIMKVLGAPGLNQDVNSLQPATTTTTFRTGAAAGNVAATTLTFNNIPKDAPRGTFQMVAWITTLKQQVRTVM